jgi:hypothetical protein
MSPAIASFLTRKAEFRVWEVRAYQVCAFEVSIAAVVYSVQALLSYHLYGPCVPCGH